MENVASDLCAAPNLPQIRQFLRRYQNVNGSWFSGNSAEESLPLQFEDHLVNGGRGDPKMELHLPLRRWFPVNLGIIVDKSEILPFLLGEISRHILRYILTANVKAQREPRLLPSGAAVRLLFGGFCFLFALKA